jgi:chromatin segregation and condensation protein Rec8/ScpA/Scc1 (kleisin family)|tara:strand:- start:11792 stop:12958 length:1167 start_codon:yes stop_codon:yes gene_type:complete
MQQAVLDDWFLRQDILDQLMNQEEEASEAERYADRIMRIAQEDSAEHQVLTDPFDRSVALVLSLVKEEGMDPWNIDLSAFLKLFTQRVRKESSGLDLPACGRLIRMSWEVLTQQASTLFDRVIAMDMEDEDEFFDFGWEAEYDDEEFIFTSSVLEGSADQHLPAFFGERMRRDEGRPSTLGELLSALKDACDEAEILKAKEEYRKAHAEELKNMLDNVGSRMHNEDMEGDIRRCWSSMRKVTQELGQSKVPVVEVTNQLKEILLETFGEIPEGYDVESKITSFVAGLFLTHRGYAWISQEGPEDPIMLEDRWPNAETFDEVTVLAEKLMEEDSQSIKGDETESMRHAARLAERAQQAIEEEKERLKQEEMAKLAAESESENPGDWLVE